MEDYMFLKGHLSSIYGISAADPEEETHVEYVKGRRLIIDKDGCVVLETVKPLACANYETFEGICIAECCSCSDPHHCKIKPYSREPVTTINEIIGIMIKTDICWTCSECYGVDDCKHEAFSDMTVIAINMIKEGRF